MGNRKSGLATLLVAFALALGAGVVVGMVAGRRPVQSTLATPIQPPPDRRPWITSELKLTPQQTEQMRKIWADAMEGPAKAASERRRALQKERDESFLKFFTSEQKAQYDKQKLDYDARIEDIDKERRASVSQAVERTKQILNDEQRKKYEALLLDHDHGNRAHHGGGGGPRGGPRGPDSRPSRPGGGPNGMPPGMSFPPGGRRGGGPSTRPVDPPATDRGGDAGPQS